MSLARDWTRQLYRASGAALLVPATMIIALAVLALGGGFGGLGALGQVFSGPAVPVGSPFPGARVPARTVGPPLAVVRASPPATRAPALLAAAAPAAGVGGTRSPGAGSGGGGRAQRISPGGHGVAPPGPKPIRQPSGPPAPVTSPTQPPTPGPVHTILTHVLSTGQAVTSQLPAPLAAVGTGALQSLGQTLNQLLPAL